MKDITANKKMSEIKAYMAELMRGYRNAEWDELEPGRDYAEHELYRNYDDYCRLKKAYSMVCDLQALIDKEEKDDTDRR